MRNKVARHYGGHPFEERYACLTDLQIVVLYRQAFLDEADNYKHIAENYVRPISDAWSDKFDKMTEMISLFSNAEMFKRYKDYKDQKEYEQEIEEKNLTDVLFETLNAVPAYYEIETAPEYERFLKEDTEYNELITGWVSNKDELFKDLRG